MTPEEIGQLEPEIPDEAGITEGVPYRIAGTPEGEKFIISFLPNIHVIIAFENDLAFGKFAHMVNRAKGYFEGLALREAQEVLKKAATRGADVIPDFGGPKQEPGIV